MQRVEPGEVRARARVGAWTGHTSGAGTGYVQANLAVVDAELAATFRGFCVANPRPLPLIEETAPGVPDRLVTAPGADLRTDLPRYRVYRHGRLADEVTDVSAYWTPRSVGFLLGCSFTAEEALLSAGVRLRQVELGQSVAMFRTSIACAPVGAWHGPLVVSMRPIRRDQLEVAISVTGEYPLAHGAPLHLGDPADIGITNLAEPDWGDAIDVRDDEILVFWACGVTPQAVIEASRPPLALAHAPGHMFVTDIPSGDVRGRDAPLTTPRSTRIPS